MADQKLPEGIRLFPKNENAPDFVLASMVITLEDLTKYFKENQDLLSEYNSKKQLRLQILKSKEGKPYVVVDTFKPTPKVQNRNVEVIELESDLPF